MTGVQTVRPEEDLAISRFIPTSLRSKVLGVEFVCGTETVKYLVRVSEAEAAPFSLEVHERTKHFNATHGLGNATEKSGEKAINCRRAAILKKVVSDAGVIDVTAEKLVELVTSAFGPNVH